MENKLSVEWNKIAHQAWKLKRKRKELIDQEQTLFNQLKESVSVMDTYTSRDFIFKPIQRKGSILYSKVPMIKEMELEEFRGETIIIWKLEKK